jgi:hypothetical protein
MFNYEIKYESYQISLKNAKNSLQKDDVSNGKYYLKIAINLSNELINNSIIPEIKKRLQEENKKLNEILINLDNNFNRLLVNCWNFNSQININSNDLSAINGMFIDCCNFNSSVNFYTNYINFSYIFINCPNYGANTFLHTNNVLNIYYPFSNLQKRVNVFIYNNILSNFVNARANNNGVNQIWLYDINTKELLLKGDIE